MITRVARVVVSVRAHLLIPAQRRPVRVRVQPRARVRVLQSNLRPVRESGAALARLAVRAVHDPVRVRLPAVVRDRRHRLLTAAGRVGDRLRVERERCRGVLEFQRAAARDEGIDGVGGDDVRERGDAREGERGGGCAATHWSWSVMKRATRSASRASTSRALGMSPPWVDACESSYEIV